MGSEVREEYEREQGEKAKRMRTSEGFQGKRCTRMEEAASRLLLGHDPTDEFLSSD